MKKPNLVACEATIISLRNQIVRLRHQLAQERFALTCLRKAYSKLAYGNPSAKDEPKKFVKKPTTWAWQEAEANRVPLPTMAGMGPAETAQDIERAAPPAWDAANWRRTVIAQVAVERLAAAIRRAAGRIEQTIIGRTRA